MKVIIFLLIALALTQKFDFKKLTDDKNYCARNFVEACAGKSCLAKSDGCVQTQKRLKDGMKKIGFVINDEKVPFMSMGVGDCTEEGAQKSYGSFSGMRLSLLVSNLVQYKNLDADCGFDPELDEIVKMYNLSEYTWSNIVKTQLSTEVTEFYMFGTSGNDPKVEVWVYLTKAVIVQEGEGEQPIVSPSTLKIAVNVTGITYEAGAEGFGISVLMVGPKRTRTRTQQQTQTQYKPEDPNTINNAYGVGDEDEEDMGFFAFEKRVKSGTGAKKEFKHTEPKLQQAKLQTQQMTQLRQRLQFQAGTQVEEIWFSICEKVEYIYWDPFVGGLDTGAGYMYGFGLLFLLVIVIVNF